MREESPKTQLWRHGFNEVELVNEGGTVHAAFEKTLYVREDATD